MGTSLLLVLLAGLAVGEKLTPEEMSKQVATYQTLRESSFSWKFDEMPLQGGVPNYRVPYSGYIYPDTAGGTVASMRKYDQAFHGGRRLAIAHEEWDTTAFKEPVPGLFGSLFKVKKTPDWYGHCNGWTAAAIRHAEPAKAVVRNGVSFSPAEIKGLLAELYMYNEHIVLAGENSAPIGAASFHALIANWIGRAEQPLGLEAEPGEEKWNYPAYAYAASVAKHSPRQIEVTMNLVYASDTQREWDASPRIREVKYFHYMLELTESGDIAGGRFLRDSATVDMLWVPLNPKAPGSAGNESGNPYLDVEKILSIWRESVPDELYAKWQGIKSQPATVVETAPQLEGDVVVDVVDVVGTVEIAVHAPVGTELAVITSSMGPAEVNTASVVAPTMPPDQHCFPRVTRVARDDFRSLMQGEVTRR